MSAFAAANQPGLPLGSPHGSAQSNDDDDIRLLADLFGRTRQTVDARQMAESILKKAGTLGAALSLSPTRLKFIGATDEHVDMLRLVQEILTRSLRRRLEGRPLLSNIDAVVEYLHVSMAFRPLEVMRVLFLSSALHLLHDEVMGTGTIDSCSISTRELIGRSIEVKASAIILVHNHPSGVAKASPEDRRYTQHIINACAPANIRVVDHIIIADSGYVSLREEGFFRSIDHPLPHREPPPGLVQPGQDLVLPEALYLASDEDQAKMTDS